MDDLGLALGNTDLATLAGFEISIERDVNDWLTGFAVISFLEGRDHTRSKPTRMGAIIRGNSPSPFISADDPRSFVAGADNQPLPSIPPLEARVGLRIKQPCDNPAWGAEIEARMVDSQDRIATSLFERATPGFTVWNIRGYWRPREKLTIVGGVENFGDRFYREHLDYLPGFGVRRPGANFYLATELTY